MQGRRKRVLFVCIENSNRSQMAEAFARMHGGGGVEALSAGSRPSGRMGSEKGVVASSSRPRPADRSKIAGSSLANPATT